MSLRLLFACTNSSKLALLLLGASVVATSCHDASDQTFTDAGMGGSSGAGGGTTVGQGGQAGVGGTTTPDAGGGGTSAATPDAGGGGTSAATPDGGCGASAGTPDGGCGQSNPDGPGDCLELTPEGDPEVSVGGTSYTYELDTVYDDAGANQVAMLHVEFRGEAAGDTGTIRLGSVVYHTEDFANCRYCVSVSVQNGSDFKQYFAGSGSLEIEADSDHLHGKPNLTIENAYLGPFIIDNETNVISDAPGRCLYIRNFRVYVAP
jgi:hypothetical protein